MNMRQLGRFSLPERVVRERPNLVAQVFALISCVPVRAEMLFESQAIEYVALSDRFREIEEGERVPEYYLEITNDGNLVVEITEKYGWNNH